MFFVLKIISLLFFFLVLASVTANLAEKVVFIEKNLGPIVCILLVVFSIYMCLFFDKEKRRKTIKRIQKKLKKRTSIPNEIFEQAFEKECLDIAYKVRRSIASFYGIEENKILPNDNLKDEFACEYFGPSCIIRDVFPGLLHAILRGQITFYPDLSENRSIVDLVKELNSYKKKF